ncbi:hypothetical protein B0H14DRAFT_2623259 [Mycena olivaceomarginata]|nr:hypothetical protein B0H14DRAFT_2623259 [Mycena olivaceomarginata]
MPELWRVFITARRPSPKATNHAFLIQDFEIPSCPEDSQWKLLTSARLPLGGEGRGNDFAGMSPIGINKFVRDHEDVLGGLDISARSWVIIDQKRLETSLAFWVNRPWCKKSSTATKPRLRKTFQHGIRDTGKHIESNILVTTRKQLGGWFDSGSTRIKIKLHGLAPDMYRNIVGALHRPQSPGLRAMSEKKIDAILTSKAALEHQGTRDGEHVAKIVLPAWNVRGKWHLPQELSLGLDQG